MFEKINREKSKLETRIIIGYSITGLAFILYLPLGASIGGAAFFIIAFPFIGGAAFAGYNQKKIKGLSNGFKEKHVTEVLKK
ncbi:MAG TPA: hypothetical protein VJ878_01245, partial [Candidatus Izemoplasmatales bacterium]|nr:hypothetical protein [Candidatus Izemoplasmatales bacterium]